MNKYFQKAAESLERMAEADEFRYDDKSEVRELRRKHLQKMAASDSGQIVKQAFDTRRINQETDANPRRNLQNYQRSESFIDKDSSEKIKTFFKLKTAVDSVKEDFLGDPDWHDSYCRILSAALDRTLRVDQKDADFFKPQLDYLDELVYLRYRLNAEDIQRFSERELRTLLIGKDEKLLHKTIYSNMNFGGNSKAPQLSAQSQQIIKGNDQLLEKLFGDVRATADRPSVQRTITITINDKFGDGESRGLEIKS